MKVLLVEDDVALARGITEALVREGMVVEHCADGVRASELRASPGGPGQAGGTGDFDAAVLDLGLPGIDGMAVLRQWRARGRGFSVLVLTARSRWSDKLEAFQAGADDYLTKPFLMEEVVTRLRVLQRRQVGLPRPVVQQGPLSYDTVAATFALDGAPLALTAQEQRILAHLITRPGALVTREDLVRHVYARDLDPDSNSLDVLIGRIRRKLAPHALIHTERGRGYRLQHEHAGAALD
ncbi:MAG: response regulator transcription factor [Hydrogenophaga sp.]|nr:response regulator transcription factor [Hydrogenophaga sp.]